jgi:hypothetical protein
VECKAKTVDAGRRIARKDFFQFVDRLLTAPGLSWPPESHILTVRVPGRFPADLQNHRAIIRSALQLFERGGSLNLSDGTQVSVEIVSDVEAARWLRPPNHREHRVVLAENQGEPPKLVVSSRSLKSDRMIDAIERDLHDALYQLSGERPGIISCYVPEVENFKGTNEIGSATWQMINRTFGHSKAKRLVSIALHSSPQLIDRGHGEVETPVPCVRFVANGFKDTRLGAL